MKEMLSILAVAVTLYGCSSTPAKKTSQAPHNENYQFHAEQGLYYMQTGKLNLAIIEFDEAIKQCETRYQVNGTKIHTSRTTAESLMYTVLSATKNEPVEVVDIICSDAYYLRGFVALHLGRARDAEGFLKKAVDMAPVNAMYLSALAHIYQVRGDWNQAIVYFTQAEDTASTYSPEKIRVNEFSHAKRGIGFNLIQLGKLDEAEEKYKECLAINAGDKGVLDELEYIKKIREKNTLLKGQ